MSGVGHTYTAGKVRVARTRLVVEINAVAANGHKVSEVRPDGGEKPERHVILLSLCAAASPNCARLWQ